MGPGPPEFQRTFPLRKPIAGDDRQVSLNFLFIFSCLAFSCIFFFILPTFFSISSFFLFLSYFLNIIFIGHFLETAHCMSTLQRYNIDNSKQIFLGKELRGYSPSSLWAIYIFLWSVTLFFCRKIGGPNMGTYSIDLSQTHEFGNWDWRRAIPFLGILKSKFLCSVPFRSLWANICWAGGFPTILYS